MSPYEYYLELLGTWANNPALPSQWFITFHLDSVNCIKDGLQNQLRSKESTGGNNGWSISENVVKTLTDGKVQYSSEHLMGCAFAKGITLPAEIINAQNIGLEYGGYRAPLTTSNRLEAQPFACSFIETNASFTSLILRPWVILTSYNGVVARRPNSPKNTKCKQVDICLLAKTGSGSPMGIRKIYRFTNVVPTSIEGEDYNHNTDVNIISKVSFAYDTYSILDQDSKIYIDA